MFIQITENSRYGSDQRERVYDPELFGTKRQSVSLAKRRMQPLQRNMFKK